MINFTPINKNVRRTLEERSEELVRNSVSDPFALVSEDLISTTSRSIWVKMFSPVLVKKEGQLVEGAKGFLVVRYFNKMESFRYCMGMVRHTEGLKVV